MKRKVAIVARAPDTRYQAPFHDPDWEIWTLSPQEPPVYCDLPRWDRYYELHSLEEKEVECPGLIDWLHAHGSKVWLRAAHPRLPEANVYPLEQVREFFQRGFEHEFKYYNNQVSLMMAHALAERDPDTPTAPHLDDLGVWGANMCQFSEYGTQRPSLEVFAGYAAAVCKMHIPEQSDLCKVQRIYGIEDPGPWEGKLVVHEEELKHKLQDEHRTMNEAKKQVVGASAAHGELKALVEESNGQLSEDFKTLVASRLGQLEDIIRHNEGVVEERDTQIKMMSGALEEVRYQRQFI